MHPRELARLNLNNSLSDSRRSRIMEGLLGIEAFASGPAGSPLIRLPFTCTHGSQIMPHMRKAALLTTLVGLLGLILASYPFGDIELTGLRWFFEWRGARDAPPEVLVVALDSASAEVLGLSRDIQKWPRSLYARLVSGMAREGATVIVFDVFFKEHSSAAEDDYFAQAIEGAGNVVLCEQLEDRLVFPDGKLESTGGFINIEQKISPIPPLARSAVGLGPFPLLKSSSMCNQYWAFRECAETTPTLPVIALQVFALDSYESLATLITKYLHYLPDALPPPGSASPTTHVERLVSSLRNAFRQPPGLSRQVIDQLEHPDTPLPERKAQLLRSLIKAYAGPEAQYLNFYGPARTVKTIPLHVALHYLDNPGVLENRPEFKGKAVFVGASDLRPDQKDGFQTVFYNPNGIDLSGVEIAATAFGNLLEDMPVRRFTIPARLGILLLWALFLGTCCVWLSAPFSIAAVCGVGSAYFLFASWRFGASGVWYPLVIPICLQAPFALSVSLFWKYLQTGREKKTIRKAFGYFLPGGVVDQVVQDIAERKVTRRRGFGTVLCTDGEQYTALSEKMAPSELSSFMNRYYESIFQPVERHGGIVSEIKGDSMLAIWIADHPEAALKVSSCLAAIDLGEAVRKFNEELGAFQLPTRIGVHYGEFLVGSVGGGARYEYQPVGDVVNTASRMEGLNKKLGTRILVSEEVLEETDLFFTREVGQFLFAGKSKPVTVHELICVMEDCDTSLTKLREVFAAGLAAYRMQQWKDCVSLFEECLRIRKTDGPARFYIGLCREHIHARPQDKDWKGVVPVGKN
jgi:adenylate cyclase